MWGSRDGDGDQDVSDTKKNYRRIMIGTAVVNASPGCVDGSQTTPHQTGPPRKSRVHLHLRCASMAKPLAESLSGRRNPTGSRSNSTRGSIAAEVSET